MPKATLPTIALLVLFLGVAGVGVGTARAQQIEYVFTDPVGDQTGPVDVTGLFVIFDLQGNYTIYITADPAHPFFGKFRVNVNLYNPDVAPEFSAFSHACTAISCGPDFGGTTDYDIKTSRTTLRITGHDKALQHWPAGTRAVTSSFAGLGNPPGASLFRTGVSGFPLTFGTNEDCIACDGTGVVVGQLEFSRRGWILPVP